MKLNPLKRWKHKDESKWDFDAIRVLQKVLHCSFDEALRIYQYDLDGETWRADPYYDEGLTYPITPIQ